MNSAIEQDHISLRDLQFLPLGIEDASGGFTATVLYDGQAIADVRNDGLPGMTFLFAHEGREALLAEAEGVAKEALYGSLASLVGELAADEYWYGKLRPVFVQNMAEKLLFICNDKLLYIDTPLTAIGDWEACFAALRASQESPIVILAELPPRLAFRLWRHYGLGPDDTAGHYLH
ncbi:FIG01218499: hypothetical protein [plant metagenome]|uniref:Uncharacterized protein n=1 Tax=plant metagenome TaxID=1297885 RepID=A0A484PDV1_9ZZZZ